jgi:DNA polymerase-3 subunit beta
MNIECVQEKLIEGIRRAERIATKHITLPVLSCLLLEAKKNNTLTIKATNLNLGIEITIPAKVHEEGIIAVPASVISSFISGITTEDKGIIIKTHDQNISIKTSSVTSVIKTMPHEEFPNIPKIKEHQTFSINSNNFLKGLQTVWYAASVSDIKPELSSVYIYYHEGSVVFAATDSFRLAEKKIILKKDKENMVDFDQILIPFKNIPEIMRILESINDDLTIELSKNQIAFNYKGLYLISRVIDGTFPDYRQIIPKETKTEVVLLKQDIINALKISHIFSDKFNQIHVKISPQSGIFELRTNNKDVGETVYKLGGALTGEDIEINFNYRYIADCFQSIEADSISLSLSGLNRPMVMRPVGDMSFTYLVMPMNR